MYAYREARLNRDSYSLHYLSRTSHEQFPPTLDSELGSLISSKKLRGERAILVCSERLTREDWREIPPRSLLAVTADLEPHLERVR